MFRVVRIKLFIYLIFTSCNLLAQSGNLNKATHQDSDELVCTPFGEKLKSNVHYIDNQNHLELKKGQIQIVNNKTHEVKKLYKNNLHQNYILSDRGSLPNTQDQPSGWITSCYTILMDGSQCTYFSTTYIVPPPPKKKSNQTIYIFNAFVGPDDIIQPVLQWGISYAGGGDYWSICNWYINDQNQVFYDSLIRVNPGTKLEGIIKASQSSNDLYDYNSSFQGYPTSLQINNIHALQNLYVALEVYGINSDDEYPSNEKITLSEIQIKSGNNYPPIHWATAGLTWTKTDKYTNIVNGSAHNGEVDIHFHSPYSKENYHDIHVYPNPVEDFLHISANPIEDPLHLFPDQRIINCTLDVYNASGVLMQSYFYKDMTYEFDLYMYHYAKGAYIFKFSYYYKSHSSDLVKKSHSFKIIKN